MAEDSPVLETPPWIWDHLAAHGGGWFHPIRVVDGHPVVGQSCFDCDLPLLRDDVVFVMPHLGVDGSRWVFQHRTCVARQIFGADAESVIDGHRLRTLRTEGATGPATIPDPWVRRPGPDEGRPLYLDAGGRQLLQRPDGEWTIMPVGSPVRLELCTNDLGEAKRRADWSSGQWEAYRLERDSDPRRVVVVLHTMDYSFWDLHVANDVSAALGYVAGTERDENLRCVVEGDPNHSLADLAASHASEAQREGAEEALRRIAMKRQELVLGGRDPLVDPRVGDRLKTQDGTELQVSSAGQGNVRWTVVPAGRDPFEDKGSLDRWQRLGKDLGWKVVSRAGAS